MVIVICAEKVNVTHSACSVYKIFTSVPCLSLTDLNNGMTNCSLGDDGVPSYEDTCSFTCNTGYELTGSDTRTCQNNGSWSGDGVMCRRGRQILYVMEYCYY